MGGLAGLVERDNDGKTYGHFSSGHGDDKENEHLSIVILLTMNQAVTRESDEREIGGTEHHFEAHENDDDTAAKDDTTEADGEEKSACKEIVSECRHSRSGIVFDLAKAAVTQDDDTYGGNEEENSDDFKGETEGVKESESNRLHIIHLRAGEEREWLGKGWIGNHKPS